MATTVLVMPARQLRAELKEWEKSFTAAHGGRKASRDDIKKDPAIAQKYKDYNRLTGRGSARDAVHRAPAAPLSTPRKRRRSIVEGDEASDTPEKRSRKLHPAEIDPYDLPVQRTPTATRTCIGPTPQKNGQVLGLFDLLSPVAGHTTPSRTNRQALNHDSFTETPSKVRATLHASSQIDTTARTVSTPRRRPSQGQSQSLVTPASQRCHSGPKSGSGRSKQDETPAFLKRYGAHNEAVVGDPTFSPIAVRLPPRPAGKGLSALVQGLKNMEEERLDDDLDLLREVEAEESGGLTLPRKPVVLVEDSQVLQGVELPLGADGEHAESEDELAATATAPAHRVWKKRGQKRTTRKANIAPSTVKWKPEPEWKVGNDEIGDDEENGDNASSTTLTGFDRAEAPKAAERKAPVRKKISATAHANFRALKIRSKNSKSKGSFRGRRR